MAGFSEPVALLQEHVRTSYVVVPQIPVAFDDAGTFSQGAAEPYIRFTVAELTSRLNSVGPPALYQHVGVATGQVFVPKNRGALAAATIAEGFAAIFFDANGLPIKLGSLQCYAPEIFKLPPELNSPNTQLNVSVRYLHHTSA